MKPLVLIKKFVSKVNKTKDFNEALNLFLKTHNMTEKELFDLSYLNQSTIYAPYAKYSWYNHLLTRLIHNLYQRDVSNNKIDALIKILDYLNKLNIDIDYNHSLYQHSLSVILYLDKNNFINKEKKKEIFNHIINVISKINIENKLEEDFNFIKDHFSYSFLEGHSSFLSRNFLFDLMKKNIKEENIYTLNTSRDKIKDIILQGKKSLKYLKEYIEYLEKEIRKKQFINDIGE